MANFSTVTLVGHLGRSPETKYTPGGDSVTEFSIATSRKRKSGETTTWWRCAMWGKRGEVIAQHLHKGDPILVTGEPFVREWQDQEGKARQSLEVDVREFAFVGGNGEQRDSGSQRSAAQPATQAPAAGRAPNDFDDDIPFTAHMSGMEWLA